MRKTPLYEAQQTLGCKIVDFQGWAMPVQYDGILEEHHHTRTRVSVFDCSHMAEFRVEGEEAIQAYGRLVTNDISSLLAGRARYGALTTAEGGIIDDVITMRTAEDALYVVANVSTAETISSILTAISPGVRDVSDETAKIDVQGPESRDVLTRMGFAAAGELRYFHNKWVTWEGWNLLLSRTGYTGELGYELFVPNEAAVSLWQALLEHEAVKPAGLGARDTLRLEVGYPLSGQDFDKSRTPLEANMHPFIAWDTEFPGKAILEKQKADGGHQRLTAIETEDRRAPRSGFEVFDGDQKVGVVTSGGYGPSVGHGVGLAYLDPGYQEPGHDLTAGPRQLSIKTVQLPFYKKGTARK